MKEMSFLKRARPWSRYFMLLSDPQPLFYEAEIRYHGTRSILKQTFRSEDLR